MSSIVLEAAHQPIAGPPAVPPDTGRRAAYGLLSSMLPLAATLLVTPLVLRALGDAQYGLYTVVVGLGGYVLSLAPTRALVREVAVRSAGGQLELALAPVVTTALVSLVVGAGLGALLWLGADWIAARALRLPNGAQPAAAAALRLFTVALPLILLRQALSAVPQGLHRFDLEGRLVLLTGFALILGNGALALTGAGLQTLVTWSVAIYALAAVGSAGLARWLLPRSSFVRAVDLASLAPLLHLGAAALLYQSLGQLLLLFERTYVLRSLGAGALTYYAIPLMIAISLQTVFASLSHFFFPLAAQTHARGDTERLRSMYRRALRLLAAPITLAVMTLVSTERALLELWLGAEFAERAAPALSLLAITFGLIALLTVPWQTADALGLPHYNVALAFSWLLVNGVLLVLLVPRFGLAGAGWARVASMAAVPLYLARLDVVLFGRVQWRFWGRTVVVLGPAALASAGAELALLRELPSVWWRLPAALLAGTVIFVVLLLLLRYLAPTERTWLTQRLGALVAPRARV